MAVDRRQKNQDWYTADPDHNGKTILRERVCQGAILATLMDIRDELQAIHRLMLCPNVARGFRAMQSVDRRLARGIVTRRTAKKVKR